MKLQRIALTVAAAFALGLAGCSKNEPATPAAEDANKAANADADAAAKTAATAKAEAARVAEAAKVAAAKAAEDAKAEAARVADAAKVEAAKTAEAAKAGAAKAADTARIQALIDNAKSLVAGGKYTEAASALEQLANETLSSDQTTLVNALKEQIQKALAAKATENAAGAVGNLLKK